METTRSFLINRIHQKTKCQHFPCLTIPIVQSLSSAGRKGYLTPVLPGTFPTAQMGSTMHFITSTFTTLMKYTKSVHLWNQRGGKEISSKEQVFLLLKLPLHLGFKEYGKYCMTLTFLPYYGFLLPIFYCRIQLTTIHDVISIIRWLKCP